MPYSGRKKYIQEKAKTLPQQHTTFKLLLGHLLITLILWILHSASGSPFIKYKLFHRNFSKTS